MVTLSIVVPATNAPPTLGRCTTAIDRAKAPGDEVVVVEEPRELSASGARNAGASRATRELLVFVDADVEVHPNALDRIRAAFAADGSLTAIFGSYDDAPHAPGVVSAFRNLLHHHVHQVGAGPAETFWTGLGAVRRDRFLAVGGFDAERFPHPSIEDIELGDRLADSGARLVLDPTIQGTHLKAWTLRTMVWTDFARRGIPWVALQLRTGRISTALNCGWRHRVSALACIGAVLGALAWQPALIGTSVALLVGLNHGFYALLVRRRGPAEALCGLALHGLYHLAAVAAVPAGALLGASTRAASAWSRRPGAPRASEGTLAP